MHGAYGTRHCNRHRGGMSNKTLPPTELQIPATVTMLIRLPTSILMAIFKVNMGKPVPTWFSSCTFQKRTSGDEWHVLWESCLSYHTSNSIKARKGTQSIDSSQWLVPHPFFIYHHIPSGRRTALFMLAFSQQYWIINNVIDYRVPNEYLGTHGSPMRDVQSTSDPVCESTIRKLAYPRVVQ